MTSEQRGWALHAGTPAALHDQSAEDECPQADGRARAAPGCASDCRRLGRLPRECGPGRRHRERELGPRAEADMRRDRLDHTDAYAARKPEALPGATGDGERPLGIRALGGDVVARARLDDRRWTAEGHAQTAETPSAAAGGVEHPHVQARGRLDAD